MATTEIKTDLSREITVVTNSHDRNLRVEDTDAKESISSYLTKTEAVRIGVALIESAGTTVGELAKEQAEKAEREKAEKLQARQEELAKRFSKWRYVELNNATRSAIDYIIELEDAAKP